MAYERDITADDKVFFDTDRLLIYRVWQGDPTDAEIAAGTAVPQNVTGYTLSWVFRKNPGSADPPLIEKLVGAGIAIVGTYNVDPTINTQRVEVFLENTDTYDPTASPEVRIKPGLYNYALKRLDDNAESILAWGKFTLLQAAAWEAN